MALRAINSSSSLLSFLSTYTLALESNAELISKDGFSVVAPIKVNSPDSI